MQTIKQTGQRTASIFNRKIKQSVAQHRNDRISCVSEYDLEEAYIMQKEEDLKWNPAEHHKIFEHKMRNIPLH